MAIVRLVLAIAAEKLADVADAIAAVDQTATITIGGNMNAADTEDAELDRKIAHQNRMLNAAKAQVQNSGKQPAKRQPANVRPSLAGMRTVYVAVGSPKAQKTAAEQLQGYKAVVFRAIMKHSGKFGMSDLQTKLADTVNAKTVDGSLYALRKMGVIESKQIAR